MKTVLTIAGSDPTSGAGIQIDLKVFKHFGVYGLSIVSALTAQNTYEINKIAKVEESFIEEQLNTIISDIRPDAIKTGMLFSIDAIKIVAKIIKGFDLKNLVVDPVTISSTGTSLIEDGALDALKNYLFPLANVITPNIYEAAVLSGVNITSVKDIKDAAIELKKLGPEVVIITGGHFDEIRKKKETVDLVFDGKTFNYISGKKIKGEYHGTGCAFSAGITACLAKGIPILEAIKKTKKFLEHAIKNAYTLGKGMRLLNV